MDKQILGQFIAETRKNTGISQQQLAQQLHVTNTAVSKWERGLSFPDIALLENLAAALGLSLTELLSCEKSAEPNTTSNLKENVTSLLDIANATTRKHRAKTYRNVIVAGLAVIFLVVCAYLLTAFTNTHTGYAIYIGSQTKDSQNYIYMDLKGELLCLLCEDPQAFNAITSGFPEQGYTIEYRPKFLSQPAVLKNYQINDSILGTPLDEQGSIIGLDSFLGYSNIWKQIVSVSASESRPRKYTYTFRYYQEIDDKRFDILTIKDCHGTCYYDYDNDGITEVFVLTKYEDAPYLLYDIENGVISHRFIEDVPAEVVESIRIGYHTDIG